jgi:DNA-binding MarR family transcriptional regulator
MVANSGYSGVSGEALDPKAVLEVCLCHHIRRGSRAITRAYDAALAPAGLTAGQFIILTAVAALQPMPVPVLREILAMDRTSLSRTLKPLKEAEFITSTTGAGRRAGLLTLLIDGAAALREAGPLWRAVQAETAQRLGTGRAGQLLTNLTETAALLHTE